MLMVGTAGLDLVRFLELRMSFLVMREAIFSNGVCQLANVLRTWKYELENEELKMSSRLNPCVR